MTFSMLEIYCEMLNDLLDPSKLNLDVQVKQPGTPGQSILLSATSDREVKPQLPLTIAPQPPLEVIMCVLYHAASPRSSKLQLPHV